MHWINLDLLQRLHVRGMIGEPRGVGCITILKSGRPQMPYGRDNPLAIQTIRVHNDL